MITGTREIFASYFFGCRLDESLSVGETSQFSVSLTCCGFRSSLLIERLLVGRISLALLDAEDGRVLGLVHVLDVPRKRALLGEPIATSLAREEPDVGMSHVMVNQSCALRE